MYYRDGRYYDRNVRTWPAMREVVVYERAGLHLVRRAWINFDLVWAVALVLTGVAVVIV